MEETATKQARKSVFPPNLEADLAKHCLLMEKLFFGIKRADFRCVAYRLAVSKKGLKGFLKRCTEIPSDYHKAFQQLILNNLLKKN
jgi:hypothetical protein